MAGINIPGVTDQYNTNETIEKLMKVERIPLTREQNQLEEYKTEKDAWRDINTHLTSLRDKTKTLYSYDNPFNNKLTTSTDELAITAEANRSAQIQSFKIDVIQPATADRFLTDELDSEYKIPSGIYTYKVGDKKLTMNWKGGSLKDFSNAINKRSNGIVKSMIIGASSGKKSLLIESLQTGKENQLEFLDEAKVLAEKTGMISPVKKTLTTFGTNSSDISPIQKISTVTTQRMPELSFSNVTTNNEKIIVKPRGAAQITLPQNVKNNPNLHVTFSITSEDTTDITEKLNSTPLSPVIPDAGFAEFNGIVVTNMQSNAQLSGPSIPPEPLEPIESKNVIYAIMEDGSEQKIDSDSILNNSENNFDIALSEYPNLKAIAIRNENTGKTLEISQFTATNPSQNLGYEPNHAISTADDAIIKYEGITITRPTNKIDDIIPEITLNVHDKTEKTATLSVKPDTEASKDALIQFVGEYNQTVAKLNILSQNKPELVQELDYLSKEEKDEEMKKLGLFQSDFSLTNIKSNMQSIVSANYLFSDQAEYTMLSQCGISTNASGFSGSYSASRLRGYLEIDEKKLDSALENHLDEIKSIFGFDSDGDLIIDSGIAYKLDKQIGAYTQTGGILALKTSTLDSKIKSSESRIAKLEDQMEDKEAELRNKYGSMQGTLSSLENQQNSITNFTKQQQNNK